MTFTVPQKTILTKLDLENFQTCEAKKQLLEFILNLANSVSDKTLLDNVEISTALQELINLLLKLKEIISQNPPVMQKSRYGNFFFNIIRESFFC